MEADVILFGQLAEITGQDNLRISDVSNTDELNNRLHQLYPALAQSKYIIAVDKEIVKQNTALHQRATIALLPPFSGG